MSDHPPIITTPSGTWHHWQHGMYQLDGKGLAWGRKYVEGEDDG